MMDKSSKHKSAMEKQKVAVDAAIENAQREKSLVVLLTGDGKGKSTSAFGMVMRALGYDQKVAVVQFIKGQQLSGEELYLKNVCPQIPFYQMGTGFTWDTQDREGDMRAAQITWKVAAAHLQDKTLDLLVLDELTYMLAYKYLDETEVIGALKERSSQLSVIVTGRGGGSALREIADTVAEVKNIKHAFDTGIAARKGVDY